MTLLSTNHVGHTVRSLDESMDFYVGLLGLEVLHRWETDAPYVGGIVGHPGVLLRVATLSLPGSNVRLELVEYVGPDRDTLNTDNANPGMSHLAFIVDDLLAVYAKWAAAGVGSVGSPVKHTTGPNVGGLVVYMIDPDGFRVELMQRR